ncbi:MAG: Mrp/NBP35 family ATP-binding protein [Planctomycetaceae bacterium]|nr:Mrp/NBP35 family ATP-binding protein [Planctomycetales bacterium]MCB9920843.1 Mrp/NBP35 family ATP-binding protein [Planctomycetaceae bacterium]
MTTVEAALKDFQDPETGRSALQLDQIRDIQLSGTQLSLTLGLTTWSAPIWQDTETRLKQQLQAMFPQLTDVKVDRVIQDRAPHPLGEIGVRVKSVIAVGSGKGGVGKSTMSASIAVGLKRAGAKVGLMDADVYGPSIPHLFGVSERPQVVDNKIQPVEVEGMPLMSMGFMVPPGEAVVWRGPMLHGAITQFLRDTRWGDLDYLIIDMPPGTGDIALTLSQLLPLTGAVVVCTPQEVALLDAVKAIAMFRKVNITVLGMVENMSGFLCPDCGKRYDIFGRGGARDKAMELEVPFLGEVPINMSIRELGDAGKTTASFDDPALAPVFDAVCHRLVSNLANSAAVAPPLPQLPVL